MTAAPLTAAVRGATAQWWREQGLAAHARGQVDIARTAFSAAVEAEPDDHQSLVCLAMVSRQSTAETRDRLLTRALRLRPDYVPALKERATVLWELGRPAEALDHANFAMSRDPDDWEPRMLAAVYSIALGDWGRGWKLYESRWSHPAQQKFAVRWRRHRWMGHQPLAGKTVLVWPEQGWGDAVMMARYVPVLRARGARVLLGCQRELVRLFRQSFPGVEVFGPRDRLPDFDYQIPCMSLPAACGTLSHTVPAVTYLRADPGETQAWRENLRPAAFRVGLCWAGTTNRIALADLAPLFDIEHVQFVNVQKDMPAADVAAFASLPLQSRGGEIRDFADTAALIDAMDVVVTVDTATAHLAGALGKRTFLLLPSPAEWRWGTVGASTPWYPSMTLIRKPRGAPWTVAAHLAAMAVAAEACR